MHPIKAVIFDMDGVLTDSEPLINAAAVAMFREKGISVQPDDFLPFVGTGEDRYIGGVAEKHSVPLDIPAAKKRTYEIYLELVPNQLCGFPGASELVRSCRAAGLKIAVASSADRVKIAANLDKIGLPCATWDAVVTGEDVVSKKPAPDIFLHAAAKLGEAPENCVVVEDAVNGVQAAKAAGMRCVAVAQTFPREALAQADLVRSRISDVTLGDLGGGPPPLPTIVPGAALAVPPRPPIRGPWGFWATLGFSTICLIAATITQGVVALVVSAFWSTLSSSIHGGSLAESGLILATATTGSLPVAVGLSALFAAIRRGPGVLEYLAIRTIGPGRLALWSVPLLVMVVLSDSVTTLLGRPIVPDFMFTVVRSAVFPPLLWFALVVAAPCAEETLFRGFFFKGLLHSRVGAPGAIIITSLVWSLIHVQYDFYGIASVFVSGLVLGYARLRTGSILTSIWMHGLMNFVATTETLWLLKFE